MIVDVSRALAVLSTTAIIKLLRSKEASHKADVKAWPSILDIDDSSRVKKLPGVHVPSSVNDTCYLDFRFAFTHVSNI